MSVNVTNAMIVANVQDIQSEFVYINFFSNFAS